MAKPTHVLLLRGINVGGKHLLPMALLKSTLEKAGCSAVRTLLQSGNAVLCAPSATDSGALAELLEQRIAKAAGFPVPVVLRSQAEFAKTLVASPFAKDSALDELHIAFLKHRPSAASVQNLAWPTFGNERAAMIGTEVHLHLPHGVARTRLTNAWMDKTFATISTQRNWATLQKLVALLGQ